MKCAFTFLVGCLLVTCSFAQRSHPRLMADAADIDSARVWMEKYDWYRAIIERARAKALQAFPNLAYSCRTRPYNLLALGQSELWMCLDHDQLRELQERGRADDCTNFKVCRNRSV